MLRELLAIGMVVAGSHLYVATSAFSTSSSPSSSSYQPLQESAGVVQHGSSSKGEDDGQGHVFKEGKAETRIQSRRGFSSLRSPFPFKNAADNNTSIKRLTALLVLALTYISVSSYVSVMLASGGLMDGAKGEGEAAAAVAMLHTAPHLDDLVVAPVSAEIEQELVDGKEDEAAVLLRAEDGKALSSSGEDEELETAAASVKAADGLSEELRQSYFASFLQDLSTSDDGILKAAAATLGQKAKRDACNIEEAKRAISWNRDTSVGRDIGLCMQIKNDAGIIDEHIAFHWAQGVSKFVIYDDGSEDNPWSVLEKYVALGIVEYHDMTGHWRSTSVEHQFDNLNSCFTSLRERANEEGLRWIIFPDLDEFVLSNIPGETLSDTLNARYKGKACLEIWRTWYGSSYRHRKPAGLVTETYLLASQDHLSGLAKLIANINPEGKSMNATRINTVHNFVNRTEIPCLMFENVKDVRINHYLRSLQDYEQKAVYGPSKQERLERPFETFWLRDINTHLSPIAADYSCRVHALLEQMQEMQTAGKIPAVERPRPWNDAPRVK